LLKRFPADEGRLNGQKYSLELPAQCIVDELRKKERVINKTFEAGEFLNFSSD
jgi:hypothetical protein